VERALVYRKLGHLGFVRLLGAAALMLLLAWSAPAFAQSAGDRALAEQLFRTGQELMSQNRYAEACPKLAESQRLDPGTGTLLNLAVCHEHEGKLASAWTELNDAATFARRDQRPDRVQYAEQRLAALEPKLSRLTIELAQGGDVPGLEIRLDGEVLGRAALGVAAPVDPGSHTVSASAAGKRPWQTKLDLAAGPAQKSVLIPKLADAPAGSAPGAGPNAADRGLAGPATSGSGGKAQRISAYVLGGAGVVGIGVGSIFGLRAISKNRQSNSDGCIGNQCPPEAATSRRAAASYGNVSTVMFIVGGVALAGAVTLYLTAPRARSETKSPAAQASLTISPGVATLGLRTTW
jgi:hypothetical protein